MGGVSYAISWLYGEFRIARFHRGRLQACWAAPEQVESQPDLVRALATAAQHIDLRSKGDVTIVHEHDLHTHDYLEVPYMKKRDLEKYLLRRVEQDKSFDEDAAWCYHKVRHRGGKEGVLLHLLPKRIVDATVGACEGAGLAVKRYVPLTEIVSAYLPSADFADDQLVLVVACFQERTELVLTLGDGEALFVRELHHGRSESGGARLVTDINRTVRYIRQQLGRGVEAAWVMGEVSPDVSAALMDGVEVPVHFDEETEDPDFWAQRGAELAGKLSANFISVFAQKNITTDVLRRAGVWSTAATVASAVLLTLLTSGLVAHRSEQIKAIEIRSQLVQQKIAELQDQLELGESKQDQLNRLRASSLNLPSLFLVHLSQLTPPGVVLRDAAVAQDGGGWQVTLQGQVRGDLRKGARTLARFEETLASEPWNLVLTQSFTESWMRQLEQGKLAEAGALGFTIEGVLR